MIYRRINNSDKKISILGLGTWSLSNKRQKKYFYKKISLGLIKKILNKSYDKGINYYDTSPAYGYSESILGNVFKNRRDKIIISTKVGIDKFGDNLDFSVNKPTKQINQSLKNLKTDYLDIVFFYTPKLNEYNIMKSYDYMCNLKKKGIISQIGVSVKSPYDVLEINPQIKFDSIQCNFNILDNRLYDKKVINIIKKGKMDIFARTVLGLGFFTENAIKKDFKFHESDIRAGWNKSQLRLWKTCIEKIKKNDSKNQNIEKIALKFVLSEKIIKSSLIGIRNLNELNDNLCSNNFIKLDKKLNNYIKKLNIKYNSFLKPKIK